MEGRVTFFPRIEIEALLDLGARVPVSAIIAQSPKIIDNRNNTHDAERQFLSAGDAPFATSFKKVIVKAIVPVDNVINCFVTPLAKSNDFFVSSSIGMVNKMAKVDTASLLYRLSVRAMHSGSGEKLLRA